MIRILQIGMSCNPGGVENFVMNLYRNIDRNQIQFDFLIDHNSPKIAYEDEIKKLGGRIYREYYRRKEIFTKNRKSIKQFLNEHPEITGVHMHANTLNPMFQVLKYAKKKGLKIRIVHAHNSGYMKKMKLKDKIYEIYARNRLKSVTTDLLACSSEAGKWMFKKNNFIVINNAIDVSKFRYNENKRKEIRKKFEINEKQLVIGHIGRMNYQKNPIFLVEILKEIVKKEPNAILLYIGTGEMECEIKNKICEYNLEHNVVLLGSVEDTSSYFNAMDIFLLPSLFEGLGIVLLEAQANGLVCYTSNNVPEIVNIYNSVHYIELEKKSKNLG